jgi:hypothetical protein
LAPQGPEEISPKLQPSLFRDVALLVVVMFTAVAPLVGAARIILAASTKFRQTLMAAPLGVLATGPAAATTDVEDVNGRPPVGAVEIFSNGHHQSCRRRWRTPLRPWRYEVSSAKKMLALTSDPRGVLAQSSRYLRQATDPTHNYRPWAIQCSSSRGGEQSVCQRCPPSGPPVANPKSIGGVEHTCLGFRTKLSRL